MFNFPPPIRAYYQPPTDGPQPLPNPPSSTSTPFQLIDGLQSSDPGRLGIPNSTSQEQGPSNQIEVARIQPSPASQPPNHPTIVAHPPKPPRDRAAQRDRQKRRVRQVANNNTISDATSSQTASTAVGTVNGHGGPAPQYSPPALTQSFGFQPVAAPQLPTVQSSNLGFMDSGNVASQEQGFSNQVEVDQIQPSPTSQPPNHFDVDSDPSQALRGLQPNQQRREVANNNASDAVSFQAGSIAVGTVYGYGGPAPQYPSPVPTQPFEFQPWDAPQPPTVQSSNLGFMGSGNVASQEQGFSNQLEVDQIQPSPTSQPPNHFDVDSDPSQALRGLQPNRQMQQVRQAANNNASDAISFQAASTAVGTVDGYGGSAPQYPPPVPTQPSEFQLWDAPQPPTPQPMFFPDYEFSQDSTDINSTTPFSYQTGQATNQYIDQGIAEYSVSDLQGTSQQFGMAATAPLDAQPFHVDGQSNVPPVLSHPSYPPQQIASASGQAIDETTFMAQKNVRTVSLEDLLLMFWGLPNSLSNALSIMRWLQPRGIFLQEISLFTHWATLDTVLAIQFEGMDAIPLTSHVFLKILALGMNRRVNFPSVWKAITPSLEIIALPFAPEAISPDANSIYFEQCPTLDRWPIQYGPYESSGGPGFPTVLPFGFFPIQKAKELSKFRATITFLLHTPRPGQDGMVIADTSPYFSSTKLFMIQWRQQVKEAQLREKEETQKRRRQEKRRINTQQRRDTHKKIEEQKKAEEKRKGKQKATDEQLETEEPWLSEEELDQFEEQKKAEEKRKGKQKATDEQQERWLKEQQERWVEEQMEHIGAQEHEPQQFQQQQFHWQDETPYYSGR